MAAASRSVGTTQMTDGSRSKTTTTRCSQRSGPDISGKPPAAGLWSSTRAVRSTRRRTTLPMTPHLPRSSTPMTLVARRSSPRSLILSLGGPSSSTTEAVRVKLPRRQACRWLRAVCCARSCTWTTRLQRSGTRPPMACIKSPGSSRTATATWAPAPTTRPYGTSAGTLGIRSNRSAIRTRTG